MAQAQHGGDEDREAEAGEVALPEVAVGADPASVVGLLPPPPLRWAGAGNVVAAAGVMLVELLERA